MSDSPLIQALITQLPSKRWFGGKARSISTCRAAAQRELGGATLFAVAVEYADGGSETYAVPLLADGSDAMESAAFRTALLDEMQCADAATLRESRVLGLEQSNTSIVYGGRVFLKFYRRLVPGLNPDFEITRFLTGRFANIPPFAGHIEWLGASLALATALVPNEGDAWALAGRMLADAGSMDQWLARAHRLGVVTGEMHRALADESGGPDFAPEPFDDFTTVLREIEAHAARLGVSSAVEKLRARLATNAPRAQRIRTHGDYHLGQVLWTGSDFIVLDFEGEPARPLAMRRAKHPPHRDAAGMLRSFRYAAHSAAAAGKIAHPLGKWIEQTDAAFLSGWRGALAGSPIAPPEHEAALLALYSCEKVLYELEYERNNRPSWEFIPQAGLAEILCTFV